MKKGVLNGPGRREAGRIAGFFSEIKNEIIWKNITETCLKIKKIFILLDIHHLICYDYRVINVIKS